MVSLVLDAGDIEKLARAAISDGSVAIRDVSLSDGNRLDFVLKYTIPIPVHILLSGDPSGRIRIEMNRTLVSLIRVLPSIQRIFEPIRVFFKKMGCFFQKKDREKPESRIAKELKNLLKEQIGNNTVENGWVFDSREITRTIRRVLETGAEGEFSKTEYQVWWLLSCIRIQNISVSGGQLLLQFHLDEEHAVD